MPWTHTFVSRFRTGFLNMKCHMDNLFKNCKKLVFTNEYGFCKASVNLTVNNEFSLRQIYIYDKKDKTYKKIPFDEKDVYSTIATLFSSKLAKWIKQDYYKPDTISFEQAEVIKLQSVMVSLTIETYEYNYSTMSLRQIYHEKNSFMFKINLNSLSDLDSYTCYVSDDFSRNFSLHPIDYSSLKEGDELYFASKGKVKVSKMYEFPNKDNKVCKVVNSENEATSVLFNDRKLFYLPYTEPKTLLDEVDDAKNGLLLLPYIAKSKTYPIYNVYWKPIKDAARYIVSLYKQVEDDNKYSIYHLADYDIDRNTHYLALENLVGGNFIFKVIAEDRNGNVIAKSRGIEVKNKNHSQLVY